MRKLTDRVRITGQLIDAVTGGHIWAERYDRKVEDIFALQDEIALSAVGAIEPSLRRAEVERVKRKRPDSLDAYDLLLRAQPDVYSGMPDGARKALPLLRSALALDPTYASAHGAAAICHHNLFLRAGLHEEDRGASIEHARSAILHGQDDALALTLAGFCIGMDAHDRPTAFTAFDAALAVALHPLLHTSAVVLFFHGAEKLNAPSSGVNGVCASAPSIPGPLLLSVQLCWGISAAVGTRRLPLPPIKPSQSNPAHSINYVLLAAALAKLDRLEEARTAAARVLELHPGFRYSRHFSGLACPAALATPLGEALDAAGLPG